MAKTATQEFLHNLRELPQTVKDSCFRLGKDARIGAGRVAGHIS